jgi:ABC-type Fe3+/spermidine/putrescine transport system ATPase subunit
MHQGLILQVGTPEEIYDAPQSCFIAQFVGTSNELRGMLVAKEGGNWLFRSNDLENSQGIRVQGAGDVGLHRPVAVMVRPERVHLSETVGSPAFGNSLQGRIEKVVYMGSELQYTIQLSRSVQWVVQVPCQSGGQKVWPVGTTLFIQWQTHDGVVLPL